MEPTSPPRGVSAGAWAVVRSPGTARRRRIPLCGTRSNHRPRRPPRGAAAGHASWDQPFITNMPDRGAGRTKDHSITNSPALPKNQLPPAEPRVSMAAGPEKGRRDKLGGRPAKETPHRTIRASRSRARCPLSRPMSRPSAAAPWSRASENNLCRSSARREEGAIAAAAYAELPNRLHGGPAAAL